MTILPAQQRTMPSCSESSHAVLASAGMTRQIYDERACEPMTISAATAHQLVSAGSPATQMPVKGQPRQIYDEIFSVVKCACFDLDIYTK